MASQPITIAVTGGIGSGKTTVARYIHKGYDAKVFFADTQAKDLLTSSSNIQLALRDAFGDYIFNNESIDTKKLSDKAFGSSDSQDIINNIIWPEIGKLVRIAIKDASEQGRKIFVMDAALIIEAGMADMYDHIMLIQADEHIRIDRASKRSGLSEEDIRKRIQLQMSEDEKEKFASVLIDNGASLDSLHSQVDSFMLSL